MSFLHIYHHSAMVLISYGGTRFFPGGHSSLLVVINTLVHFFMYGYYLQCTMMNSRDTAVTSVWWKKHITHMQLVSATDDENVFPNYVYLVIVCNTYVGSICAAGRSLWSGVY